MELMDVLPDSVHSLHSQGMTDAEIAELTEMPVQWVRRERTRLHLTENNSRLTEAQLLRELKKWDRFIWRYARGWCAKYPELDVEDVRSECIAGCIRAAAKYDASRGQFMTYALPWMRNHAQRYAEREVRCGIHATSTEFRSRVRRIAVTSMYAEDVNGRPLHESLPDDREEHQPDPLSWDTLTSGLTETEQMAIELRYKQGLSVASVSQMMGISDATHIINRAVEWMRRRNG